MNCGGTSPPSFNLDQVFPPQISSPDLTDEKESVSTPTVGSKRKASEVGSFRGGRSTREHVLSNDHHLLPVSSPQWSTDTEAIGEMPTPFHHRKPTYFYRTILEFKGQNNNLSIFGHYRIPLRFVQKQSICFQALDM